MREVTRLAGVLALAVVATAAFARSPSEAPAAVDKTITLTQWAWDPGTVDKIRPAAAQQFPNIRLDVVPVDSSEAFLQKVRTSAAAGIRLPDLPWFERGQRGALYALDLWENLEAPPYNFDTGHVFDYAVSTVRNFEGEVVAIPWDIAVAGLAYKKDLARQYLGTDDPRELERMLADWDAFFQAGRRVHAESDGRVFMFAGGLDAYMVVDGQNPVPIVENGVANLSRTVEPALKLVVEMRQAGLIGDLNQWSPGWNAALSGSNHIFFPSPVWFPPYVIEPNNPDGAGNWGLILPPGGGFNWGGTAIGIASDSPHKEAAWEFLSWFLLSREGAQVNREAIGFFTHFVAAFDDPNHVRFRSRMFGDQDIGRKWFEEIAPETRIRPVSPYDAIITDVTAAVFSLIGSTPGMTANDAIAAYRAELRAQAPELTIR